LDIPNSWVSQIRRVALLGEDMMLELIIVTLALYLLALSAALLLSEAGEADKRAEDEAATAIDALLPQTQCGDCGYPGCLPYARAIVEQDVPLNLCPPGGAITVRKLEKLLGRTSPLHSAPVTPEDTIALIDEDTCIGCVKCIHACPVDAIAGSAKQLHAVIPQYCTGCELCLPPCPVDCITMIPRHPTSHQQTA